MGKVKRTSVGLTRGQKQPGVWTWALEIDCQNHRQVLALKGTLTWGKLLNFPQV